MSALLALETSLKKKTREMSPASRAILAQIVDRISAILKESP